MTTIGGKGKKTKVPAQPQFAVANGNEFLKLSGAEVQWTGDPAAATKFNSKYEAKLRVRELADVPETRQIKVI